MNNLNGIFNTPDHTEEFDYNDVQNTNVVVTALTYIFFFIPYIFAPNSQYAKFHANQALIYLICEIVLRVASSIICTVTGFIPLVGSIVGFIVPLLVWIVSIGLFIFGIVNACNKQAKELPIVGGFTILK
ncbi:MAG: hypothetical protein LUG94_04890 [Ruminococcus sp.]|nr:hypothetical protein [Ruminococcus sp.]